MNARHPKLLHQIILSLIGAAAASLLPQSLATAANDAAAARTEAEMKPYTEQIEELGLKFQFVPIRSGRFILGSPNDEGQRQDDEGPQVEVEVKAFWIMTCEVDWKQYKAFMRRYEDFPDLEEITPPIADAEADAVSYPTPLYDESYAFRKGGNDNLPAASMTPFAARHFTKWLTLKTGRFYRLPTEAEWEYACRAGSKDAYHFGDDARKLGDYAWYFDNAVDEELEDHVPHPVGSKKPNAWGVHDMHGNVAELVIDQYHADHYAQLAAKKKVNVLETIAWPTDEYPRTMRGGSFMDKAADLRCARRQQTHDKLKKKDPQIPQSIWWFTDGHHVGFRIIRPLEAPAKEEQKRWWDSDLEEVNDVLEGQRSGEI